MTLRYFYIGALGLIAVICVYGNGAITAATLRLNARIIDSLGTKLPAFRTMHWIQGGMARYFTGYFFYGLALACGVLALYLWQLPPIIHKRI